MLVPQETYLIYTVIYPYHIELLGKISNYGVVRKMYNLTAAGINIGFTLKTVESLISPWRFLKLRYKLIFQMQIPQGKWLNLKEIFTVDDSMCSKWQIVNLGLGNGLAPTGRQAIF